MRATAWRAVNEGHGDGGQSEGHESATATRPSLSKAAPARELLPLLLGERVAEYHRQGLDIANTVLRDHSNGVADGSNAMRTADGTRRRGKEGTWRHTIGLVGKPSAGKSMFFYAAKSFTPVVV